MVTYTDSKVVDKFKNNLTISKRGLSQQYNNTDACFSFYNGDMMTYRDKIQFMDPGGRRKRATVNFNKVQVNIDSVVGFMAQNRRQAKFIARQNKSEIQNLYSKNMNALYSFHRENMNADQIETDQDADMLICGYGATETDLSYIMGNSTTSPNGEILKMRLDPKRVGWDPNSKGKNLLDARWTYYFQDYDLKDALNLFQGSVKEDFEAVEDTGMADTGYVYNPWGGLYDKIKLHDSVEWTAKEQDMVRVYNYQWFDYETFYKAKNPLYDAQTPEDALFIKMRLDIIKSNIKQYTPDGINAGDLFDFDPSKEEFTFDEDTKRALVKEFGSMINPVSFKRKCFYTAVISGEHVFTWFKSICQKGYSVKFKTGVFNEQGQFWVGMVNAMMEPAKYYNKAITEFMFTVASLSKGGVMVEEDAVEDISDFESKWARTDAVIKVQAGALSGGKIQEKSRSILPTGIDTIIQLCDSSIATNGVDPTFLGDAISGESGILYKRRIRQCISKLGRYFDSLTLYQKEDARLNEDYIRVWIQNNEGNWTRITGDDGADEFRVISQDMLAPEYDVSIQEAPDSPEDKQETAAVMIKYGDAMMQFNPQAGQAFYAESLQMLPIDSDVRNRLIKVLQPDEQMVPASEYQKLQAQLQSIQTALQVAETRKITAEAALQEAKVKTESANAVKTLEDAMNKNLENDLVKRHLWDKVTVSI